jgi:hypothetical protein
MDDSVGRDEKEKRHKHILDLQRSISNKLRGRQKNAKN